MHIFDEIGTADKAEAWLDDGARREAQDHGLRPPRLQERRLARADHEGRARHPRRASTTARTSASSTTRSRRRWTTRKGIKPNLDYPTGPAYHLIGLRHRDVHAAVRRRAGHRLDRAHHGAAGVQRAHPPAQRLQRRGRAAHLMTVPTIPSTTAPDSAARLRRLQGRPGRDRAHRLRRARGRLPAHRHGRHLWQRGGRRPRDRRIRHPP